jgi:hypothetical protein
MREWEQHQRLRVQGNQNVGTPFQEAVRRSITPKKKSDKPVSGSAITKFLNSEVSYFVGGGRTPKKGELFGVELELEGSGLSVPMTCSGWGQHADGSLRGDSIEWIFSSPCTYDAAVKRVTRLYEALVKRKVTFKNSYRTSTHVHLNYSDKYGFQVVNLFIIFTVLEDLLSRWCGEIRGGNLFCLRSRDAEHIVTVMERSVFTYQNFFEFNNDLRYAGLNLSALNKFGSVEVRTMQGCDSAKQVNQWLEILNELYQWSLHNRSAPSDVIEQVSFLGPRGFIFNVFSKEVGERLIGNLTDQELYNSLYEGVRLIQMFAYTLTKDWQLSVAYVKPSVKEEAEEKELAVEDNQLRAADLPDWAQMVQIVRNRPDDPAINVLQGQNFVFNALPEEGFRPILPIQDPEPEDDNDMDDEDD